MKINTFILTFFIVFAMISSIRFLDDNDFATDSIILHANIDNRGSQATMRGARAKFVILDDATKMPSTQSNINGNDIDARTMSSDFYGNPVPAGEYWVRLYVERHIRHRPIIVQ